MKDMTDQVKEIATKLLESGQVDVFMAWEKGDAPHQSKPFFARNVADVEKIIFDEYCIHNLSTYLTRFRDGKEKIAIVVKGCDSRGVVRMLEDHQMKRDRLHIIGINCPGMKDPLEAMKQHSGFERETGEKGLAIKCLQCMQPNPVIYDESLGEIQEPHFKGERFTEVKALEAMSSEERYQFFSEVLSTCIRCYACRQVCVACNCRTCIFDEAKPQWVGRETSVGDNFMYHIVRAFHMAGRCIECGECERVCPVNIPLMLINRKLIKDVDHYFGPYDAGMAYVEGGKPPLSLYKIDDPDDFI